MSTLQHSDQYTPCGKYMLRHNRVLFARMPSGCYGVAHVIDFDAHTTKKSSSEIIADYENWCAKEGLIPGG